MEAPLNGNLRPQRTVTEKMKWMEEEFLENIKFHQGDGKGQH